MDINTTRILGGLNPTIITGGLIPRGVYGAGTAYVVGDAVSYNNSSYVCILATTGHVPTNTTYWMLLSAQGSTGPTGATGATGATGPAGPGSSYITSFTNASLTAGILTVTHNLGNKYNNVTIYDNTDTVVTGVDAIIAVNTNSLTVNLSSYWVLTGTWHIIVTF